MTTTKYTVRLSRKERHECNTIIRKGTHKARVITRARILLLSHTRVGKDAIAEQLSIGRSTVQRIRDRLRSRGLQYALTEDARPGQPKKLDEKGDAHLVALACSDPPKGADHWTLELLRERMIADGQTKEISTVALWHRLNANALKPWREKNVVHPKNHPRVH